MMKKINDIIFAINEVIARLFYNRILARESALIEKQGKYTIFRTIKSIDKWIDEDSNIVASPIERETNYWSDKCYDSKDLYEILKLYCGFKSENINYFLRFKKPLHTWNSKFEIEEAKEYISKIDSEMQKRNLHCNTIVVRWIHLNNIQKCLGCLLSEIKPRKVCVDRGYMSTSAYLHYIGTYDNLRSKKVSREILLLLKLPIGSKGIYIRKEISDRDEYEYLIPRNTPFVIEKVHYRLFQPFVIVCKVRNIDTDYKTS